MSRFKWIFNGKKSERTNEWLKKNYEMEMEHQKLAIACNFKCYIENTMWHINNEAPNTHNDK